jgi:hypothetical protein
MKIAKTKTGFNVSHTTKEVWGVDDPSEDDMALTRQQDFEAVSRQLKLIKPNEEFALNVWKQAVIAVAIGLRDTNPAFNTDNFLIACGYKEAPPKKKSRS